MFFVSCVSHAFASVHCCLVVTCWERADLLALVGYVYCIFVTFLCCVLGQAWYLIIFLIFTVLLVSLVHMNRDCKAIFVSDMSVFPYYFDSNVLARFIILYNFPRKRFHRME